MHSLGPPKSVIYLSVNEWLVFIWVLELAPKLNTALALKLFTTSDASLKPRLHQMHIGGTFVVQQIFVVLHVTYVR